MPPRYSSRFIVPLLFAASLSYAQVDRGTIAGTVTDPNDAVIGGATVVITNTATGQAERLTTNETGAYTANTLLIGSYSVSAEKAGFQKVLQSNVNVDINKVVRVDLNLPVGTVSEQVEVTAAPPLVESETSSLGTVETQERIVDLPLNGRNFVQLAWLGAGANQGSQNNGPLRGTTDNNRPGIQVAVNGLTSFDNNFLLDGIDNNETGQGTLVVQPAPDAIQEFRVEENSMKAEFGRGGATVNVVLKSGTNQFHGGAYEFLRNADLDARNFFDPARPPFERNQFGALLGGPIVHDRTFFFVDYQGTRQGQGVSYISTVPTEQMRNGDFTQLGTMLYDPYTTNPQTAQRQLLNPANPLRDSCQPDQSGRPGFSGPAAAAEHARHVQQLRVHAETGHERRPVRCPHRPSHFRSGQPVRPLGAAGCPHSSSQRRLVPPAAAARVSGVTSTVWSRATRRAGRTSLARPW